MNESVEQHADFPSDEVLAAFIDGRLNGRTRERVVAHIAGCADCYGWWETAREMVSAETNVVPMPRPRRWMVPFSAAASAAIAASLVVVFMGPIRDVVRPNWGIEKLAKVTESRTDLPMQTRLSDLSYAPPVVYRNERKPDVPYEVIEIASEIQKATKDRPTPGNLHSMGVAFLLMDQPNAAVRAMERAICLATEEKIVSVAIQKSTDVNLLNDLASADLKYWQSPEEQNESDAIDLEPGADPATSRQNRLADAQRAIDRAAKLAPTSLPVSYNRAYILQQAHRNAEAINAWRYYLKLDSKSNWAKQAHSNLESLS